MTYQPDRAAAPPPKRPQTSAWFQEKKKASHLRTIISLLSPSGLPGDRHSPFGTSSSISPLHTVPDSENGGPKMGIHTRGCLEPARGRPAPPRD